MTVERVARDRAVTAAARTGAAGRGDLPRRCLTRSRRPRRWCASVLAGGGTLFFCGNGGSAADAQHIATEYVVRYMRNRRALPAIALTTDTSLLTAAGNDFGFDQVFSRQVEALVRSGRPARGAFHERELA